MSDKYRLIIRHRWALGDTVLLTGLVRDIHRAYPDQYEIMVDTNFTNVWWNNPHVIKFEAKSLPRPTRVEVGWGDGIRWNGYARSGNNQKEMKHILAWYHYDFERKTGIKVPVTDPYPDLHLSQDECRRRIEGRYWVILSGGKLDLTNKHWHAHRYQELVDRLLPYGLSFVQCGATHTKHVHPPLNGVLNMVGQTENVRDLWNIILHADGVICPVTGAMHIAAALKRPCVVIAGGREEPWFEAYVDNFKAFGEAATPVPVPHKFLHTIGMLPCCDIQGCWKKRVVPLDQRDLHKKSYTLCRSPIRPVESHPVPECMHLITVDHVAEAIMDYYDENILPPIGKSTGKYTSKEVEDEEVSATIITKNEGPLDIVIPNVEIRRGPVVMPPKVIREPSVDSVPQRVNQRIYPTETNTLQVDPTPTVPKLKNIDNPVIGSKYTVFVLCYGDHFDLAKRCLDSIIDSVPPEVIDLRVGCNQVCNSTLQYLKRLPITKTYIHTGNDKKYPLMREMFWDSKCPINTRYLIWFDDDTYVKDPRWLQYLTNAIVAGHNKGERMYGLKMFHDLSMYSKDGHRAKDWFKNADWHSGRHLRVRNNNSEAPNGSVIDFAVGWFWALNTEAMRQANIPDTRLNHNGGDITIGAQLHQVGFNLSQFNKGKVMVSTPKKEEGGRRVGGYEESFPWANSDNAFARTYEP
jgi:ADP-heptose:LPS heptosyltransferase